MKTKESIIHSTSALLRSGGYYGTGINDISRNVKVPKGSIYHHFPGGKNEIIAAALTHSADEMMEKFKLAMKGKKSALLGMSAVIDVFIKDLKKDINQFGCPLAAVSFDVGSENEALRKICVQMFDFWIDMIESYFIYKGIDENPREKAERFLIQFEGALMLSKIQHSNRPLKLVKQDLKNYLN